jgi:TolA-binding protein
MRDRRQESIAAYLEIATEQPQHPLASKSLYNAAYGAMEERGYAQALEYAEQFFERYGNDPLRPEVEKVAAQCQLQLGKHDVAAQLYAQLAKNEKDPRAALHFLLRQGLALHLEKKFADAMTLLQHVISQSDSVDDKA